MASTLGEYTQSAATGAPAWQGTAMHSAGRTKAPTTRWMWHARKKWLQSCDGRWCGGHTGWHHPWNTPRQLPQDCPRGRASPEGDGHATGLRTPSGPPCVHAARDALRRTVLVLGARIMRLRCDGSYLGHPPALPRHRPASPSRPSSIGGG